MIILTYIIAIIIFYFTELISSTIIRSMYLIFLKNQSFSYQFFGEFFGNIIGFYMGLLVFGWFDKAYNLLILGVVFLITWLISNRNILYQHYPLAQRIGAFLGITVMVVLNLL